MTHYAIYVRRSNKRADAADVSDETQVAAAKSMLPAGATYEVISDSGGHRSGYTDDRAGYQRLHREDPGRVGPGRGRVRPQPACQECPPESLMTS